MYDSKPYYYGTGRRKHSVGREVKATKEESATNRIAFNGYHNEHAIDNIIM